MIEYYGVRDALAYLLLRVLKMGFASSYRRRERPTLAMLHSAGRSTHTSARDLLQQAVVPSASEGCVETLLKEYEEVRGELARRSACCAFAYPREWALEEESLLSIYALTRLYRPMTVLETGVADGHSTFVLLSALFRNGRGQLYSVDTNPQSGSLLTAVEKQSWHLETLGETHPAKDFERLLRSLPPIDFFLHDSDHSYRWQHFEFTTVFSKTTLASVIAADDVDSSLAFVDFCGEVGAKPVLLLEKRKVMGFVLPPAGLSADSWVEKREAGQ